MPDRAADQIPTLVANWPRHRAKQERPTRSACVGDQKMHGTYKNLGKNLKILLIGTWTAQHNPNRSQIHLALRHLRAFGNLEGWVVFATQCQGTIEKSRCARAASVLGTG